MTKVTYIDAKEFDYQHELPRSCGRCSMCCLVNSVAEMDPPKIAGVWCQHCKPGKGGCSIYETRPEPCRTFKCMWLEGLGSADMKPDKTHCVFYAKRFAGRENVCVNVDIARPEAWTSERPFRFIQYLVALGFVVYIQIGDVDFGTGTGRMHIACPGNLAPEVFEGRIPFSANPVILRDVQFRNLPDGSPNPMFERA